MVMSVSVQNCGQRPSTSDAISSGMTMAGQLVMMLVRTYVYSTQVMYMHIGPYQDR